MRSFELPIAGEPKWFDTERDYVEIDGFTYSARLTPADLQAAAKQLSCRIKVQAFVAAEAEKSRLDCAGERARIAFLSIPDSRPSWDELSASTREAWVSAAKAVLDGEH